MPTPQLAAGSASGKMQKASESISRWNRCGELAVTRSLSINRPPVMATSAVSTIVRGGLSARLRKVESSAATSSTMARGSSRMRASESVPTVTCPPIPSRSVLALAAAALIGSVFTPAAFAAGKVTVGVVLPLSGAFADQGKHYETGMQLYQQANGAAAAGKTIELVVRDDQGSSSGDLSRRLTQELILRDHADLIVGYSFTPNAISSASLLTQAKRPTIITNAATSTSAGRDAVLLGNQKRSRRFHRQFSRPRRDRLLAVR